MIIHVICVWKWGKANSDKTTWQEVVEISPLQAPCDCSTQQGNALDLGEHLLANLQLEARYRAAGETRQHELAVGEREP